MTLFPNLKLRFHNWAVIALLCFVFVLTASVMAVVITKFNAMAEDNARKRFLLITQTGVERLKALIGGTGRHVEVYADVKQERFRRDGRLNDRDMWLTFMSQLKTEDNLYSVYFGLENDDFYQVVHTRGNPGWNAHIAAPRNTWFAQRTIIRTSGGGREESWRYWSSDMQPIGTKKRPSDYFPTVRPWYWGVKLAKPVAITDPYVFASSREPGITISSPLPGGIGVLGADLSLGSLRDFLSKIPLTPNGAIVVLDRKNRILAHHSTSPTCRLKDTAVLMPVSTTGSPLLAVLENWKGGDGGTETRIVDVGGDAFVFANHTYAAAPGMELRIAAFAPMSDFSGPIVEARNQVILVTAVFLLFIIPLAVIGARRVGRSLSILTTDAERITHLDFSGEVGQLPTILYEVVTLGEAHKVMKSTLSERTRALTVAEEKLASLVENGIMLSREQNRQALLRHILFGGKKLCNCDAGTMYLKTDRETLMFALRTKDDVLPSIEIPLRDPATGALNEQYVSIYTAVHNESVIIDDVYSETRFDLSGSHRFDEETGYRTVSMLTVPMSPREGEVIGVLQFMNALDPDTEEVIPFPRELVGFVEALASQSAVALENHNLLQAQRTLMDALIRLVAGAIDAKSPYTGGHCERVPELAIMLAEEASRVQEGPFADFNFKTEEEWREFRIGAWLHDCGKVTTPEYVVDKATKLETIYNRIHEVRTRFEVLLRDAEIECLKAIQGGVAPEAALRDYREKRVQLIDDFAFVAECNIGGESMDPERIVRLKRIAGRTWLRHLDDRLGLSHEEMRRYEGIPAPELPAVETLLSDKPWHVIPRLDKRALDPRYGFKVDVPEDLYNFGEILNLCVERGTLTAEERFKINEHIIQTVAMLDALPFPRELRRVPEYAGSHHETLTGSGYPRRLTKDDLSVPARIMAIADIFEALTASDRPYKKAKTLSESVKILSFFKKDRHIDPDLFDLFLRSGVYLRYARRFLKPEQIDEVDTSKYLN
ncbi:MAG TPA: HD domain-containing phosphohydrolase [Syntrophales bacterium]|nr:HD domain-containing phosphohydrolase [Syntrophales bacterium]